MIKAHDKKRRKTTIEYNINDKVTILVDKLDRFATDMKRIPGMIINKTGNIDIFYTIATFL